MANLSIPFVRGVHEEADPKLLPQGLLTVAQNVRWQKDGRVGVRNGFRHDAANAAFSEANVLSVGKFDQQHALVLQKRLGDDTPPAWAAHIGATYKNGASLLGLIGSNGTTIVNQQAGSLGVPQVHRVMDLSDPVSAIASSDSVVVGGFLYVIVSAYSGGGAKAPTRQLNFGGIGGAYACLYKIDPSSGAVVNMVSINASATATSNYRIVPVTGTNIDLAIFASETVSGNINVSFYNAALSIVSGATVVTAFSNTVAPYFDVCQGASTSTVWLCYQSAANTLSFGDVSTLGVFTLKNTIATTNGQPRPCIARRGLAPTDGLVVVWNDGATFTTGSFKYTVYSRASNTFTTATTTLTGTLLSGQTTVGFPVVGESSLDDWTAAWNVTSNPNFVSGTIDGVLQTTSGQTAQYMAGVYVCSRPFTAGSSTFIGVFAVDANSIAATPAVTTAGTYYLFDNDTPPPSVIGPSAEATFSLTTAQPLDTTSSVAEPRRNVVATTAAGIEPALGGAIICALPVTNGTIQGWSTVRVEYGTYEEMFQTAALNGQLFASGGRILQYDGVSLCEVGLPVPTIVGATPLAAGSMGNGTYLLTATVEWRDARGNRHQSPPSLPVSVTLAGANTSITLNVTMPQAALGNLTGVSGQIMPWPLSVRVWRTLAGGTVFHDSGAAMTTGAFVGGYKGAVMVLTAADAAVQTNEILYTQGARGGLSGILQNDRPPPARYIWAGSDRLIIGCLDNPSAYQLSKLKFQGEPINWSNTPAYTGNVDKPITGVAEMDGTYFIGTRDAIWTVSGQGPDDNGGGGTFDTPLRLPSDAGFYSAGSLVLTGEGLMFQGSPDRLYILPRGGGAPQWIGQPVRDTLAAFPWITSSAYDQDSNLVYFACVNTAGTLGRLLVYDTRIKEWSVDSVQARAIRSLAIFNGLLVIDGSIIETPGNYQDFDGSTSASVLPTLTTGDLTLFGPSGWGQYIKVQIEGEARDVTASWTLQLEVSYDSGKTFAEVATWARATLAAAIGDAIDGAEHYFVTQRTTKVRLRLSVTTASATEGMVFNRMDFEVIPRDGLKRQAPALRAP